MKFDLKTIGIIALFALVILGVYLAGFQSFIQIQPFNASIAGSQYTQGTTLEFNTVANFRDFTELAYTNFYCYNPNSDFTEAKFRMTTTLEGQTFTDDFTTNCGLLKQALSLGSSSYYFISPIHEIKLNSVGTKTITQTVKTASGQSIGSTVYNYQETYTVKEKPQAIVPYVKCDGVRIDVKTTTGEQYNILCPSNACIDLPDSNSDLGYSQIKAMGCVAECSNGQTRCNPNEPTVAKDTCVNGLWTKSYCNPTGSNMCSSGTCVPRTQTKICDEGAMVCINSQQYTICQNNAWQQLSCASNEVCKNFVVGEGLCVEAENPTQIECEENEFFCTDTSKYKYCENKELKEETCETGSTCTVDRCLPDNIPISCNKTNADCKAGTVLDSKDCSCMALPQENKTLTIVIALIAVLLIGGVVFYSVKK